MPTMITEECINCGNCVRECPNTAIYEGGTPFELHGAHHPALRDDVFYIVTDKCTDCVGFFTERQCAEVCPVDCCVPDPSCPQSEVELLAKVQAMHPDRFPTGPLAPGTLARDAPPPRAAR